MLGRVCGSMRSAKLESTGSRLSISDTIRKRDCRSVSFLGLSFARFLDWLKSSARLYSSHGKSSGSGDAPRVSQGFRSGVVLAIQPSWKIARLADISKYWVVWRVGALASSNE